MQQTSTSSDPYDVDDAIFLDTEALDSLEQAAYKASQGAPKAGSSTGVKPRVSQTYHHNVAPPKNGPAAQANKPAILSSSNRFSGHKAPQPINTEPRAAKSGFGWEYGGKRSMEGNVERHIENTRKRQEYWSRNTMNFVDPAQAQDEAFPPDIVMGENGYEMGENEVVDSHTSRPMGMPPASQNRRSEAAAVRRAAIKQATQSMANEPSNAAGPSHSRSVSANLEPPIVDKQFAAPARTLSRSVSAGFHPGPSAGPSRLPGRLSPIPSEDNASLPSSQGSLTRKTAIELAEERRRSQGLEREIVRLKKQLEARQASATTRPQRVTEGMKVALGENTEDLQDKLDELQNQLWRAKGEAETMRRAQKDEHTRSLSEAEKLREKIADMEVQLRQREKEATRQVENVKTQAVFANHAAINSAVKIRASSQMPVGHTPFRNGSPKGKGEAASLAHSIKGKGRAAPPPAPRFDSFKDAFATTPTVSRVKRARTESVASANLSPERATSMSASPQRNGAAIADVQMESPSKRRGTREPSRPAQEVHVVDFGGDAGMDLDIGGDAPIAEIATENSEWADPPDPRSELLYHLFNSVYFSAFQQAFDAKAMITPTLYRILHYEPSPLVDPDRRIRDSCAALLRMCGNPTSSYEQVLGTLGDCAFIILKMVVQACTSAQYSIQDFSLLINILGIIAQTGRLFHELAFLLVTQHPEFTALLRRLINNLYGEPGYIDQINTNLGLKDNNTIENPADASGISRLNDRSSNSVRKDVPAAEIEDGPFDLRKLLWSEELADVVSESAQMLCWYGGGSVVWNGAELVDICMSLTDSHLPIEIIKTGIDIVHAAATFSENFRSLISTSEKWPGDSPILEKISRILIEPPKVEDSDSHHVVVTVLQALSMLAIADHSAIILIAGRTLVIPALTLLLTRESEKIWGVYAGPYDEVVTLQVIVPALRLLHFLAFPVQYPPGLTRPLLPSSAYTSASQRRLTIDYTSAEPDPIPDPEDNPPHIDLVERLRDLGQLREFTHLGHQFVTTFGTMSYAVPAVDFDEFPEFDLLGIQYMSQDILEQVVEGPEADAVYGVYAEEDDEEDYVQFVEEVPGKLPDKSTAGKGGEHEADIAQGEEYEGYLSQGDGTGDQRTFETLL